MAVQIERDEFLRTFQAYTNRYRHSYEASYSTNPLYYSTDIGRAAPAPPQALLCPNAFKSCCSLVSAVFMHCVLGFLAQCGFSPAVTTFPCFVIQLISCLIFTLGPHCDDSVPCNVFWS